jgi:hypothetical protein
MNNRWLVIFSFLFVLSTCADDAPKYTRAECIVRVNIDWSGTPANGKETLINWITDQIGYVPDMGFNRIQPGFSIKGKNRQFIYYQHKYDCENRHQNMTKLLDYVRGRRTELSLPQMEVDSGSFQPGPETMRSSGPWWVDHEKPGINGVRVD